MKSYKRTLEQNKKMSEILKGRKFTKEHCDNISKSREGKFFAENNPHWKGGTRKAGEEGKYIAKYVPTHPHAINKSVLEHRLVMEKHLGRYLLPSEIVHHKDGNLKNNSIENLELMTQKEHAKKHNEKRDRNQLGMFVS